MKYFPDYEKKVEDHPLGKVVMYRTRLRLLNPEGRWYVTILKLDKIMSVNEATENVLAEFMGEVYKHIILHNPEDCPKIVNTATGDSLYTADSLQISEVERLTNRISR